jgi:hypothetical protein
MPCDPKHLEKLDAMIDSVLKKDNKDCDLPMKKDNFEEEADTQMEPGLLSKRNIEAS